jgi:hypothetical protein
LALFGGALGIWVLALLLERARRAPPVRPASTG